MSSSDIKNVVIVGASAAGANLARALETKLPSTHRIVLIDANEYAFWPIAALRAAVVPRWEHKAFKPLKGFFPADSRHVLLSKTKVVELGKGFVKTDTPNSQLGFSERIPGDISVLALGSTYSFPCRAVGNTIAEAKQTFITAQQTLKNAQNNIVLVGGGPVSIEYAGEIISQYPKKTVTIIQGGDRLLSDKFPLKLSDRLRTELENRGVRVVLGQKIDQEIASAGKGNVVLKDGTSIVADLIVNATGQTPNTKLVSATDPGALTVSGLITVDNNLRVVSSNPLSPFLTSTWFALGDAANSPGGATGMKASNDATAAAANILATIANKPLVPVAAPINAILVPVGPSGGASSLPFIGVVGGWLTGKFKGQNLMLSLFDGVYGKK